MKEREAGDQKVCIRARLGEREKKPVTSENLPRFRHGADDWARRDQALLSNLLPSNEENGPTIAKEPRVENRSETRRVCPFCKGDTSVLVDPPTAGYPQRGVDSRTWLRELGPLCDGNEGLSGRSGTLLAKGNDAKATPADVTKWRTEALQNELRAIDYWDAQYKRQFNPAGHDTVAYISRKRRRGEIIRELLCLARQL